MISEGININVTLLFALEMYEKVALAYIAGLKTYVAGGGDPSHVSSVASFFISRIDSMVDAMVKAKLKTSTDPKEQALLKSLPGKVAIANAKLTYRRYKEIFSGSRLGCARKERRADAARAVGQHEHERSDLFGRSVCRGTDRAGHGEHHAAADARGFPRSRQAKSKPGSGSGCGEATMNALGAVGISMKKVTDDLVTQAVKLFAEPFDKLLNAVDAKCKFAPQAEVDAQTYSLPEKIGARTCGSHGRLENGRQSSEAVGRATRRCGPARMKIIGSAG